MACSHAHVFATCLVYWQWHAPAKIKRDGHFAVLTEGRIGIFSWCVIGWFYFPWNVNLGNYSSWSVTWSFPWPVKNLNYWPIFVISPPCLDLFYVILKRESSEWLESSIREWLGYVICNMEYWLSLSLFCFLQTLFPVNEEIIKKSILLAYFRDSGKRNFYIRDQWSPIFSVREPCQRPLPVRPSSQECGCFLHITVHNETNSRKPQVKIRFAFSERKNITVT